MGKIGRFRAVLRGMESTNASVAELNEMMPGLRELVAFRANLDRIGPRLDLLDRIGPRTEVLDQLGPRLELLDQLGPRLDLLDQLGPRLELVDKLGGILERLGSDIERIEDLLRNIRGLEHAVGEADTIMRKYLDTNHVVAEDVRLDVDTISAVVLSAQKTIREMITKLETVVAEFNKQT
jgi:hypothetical protein